MLALGHTAPPRPLGDLHLCSRVFLCGSTWEGEEGVWPLLGGGCLPCFLEKTGWRFHGVVLSLLCAEVTSGPATRCVTAPSVDPVPMLCALISSRGRLWGWCSAGVGGWGMHGRCVVSGGASQFLHTPFSSSPLDGPLRLTPRLPPSPGNQ